MRALLEFASKFNYVAYQPFQGCIFLWKCISCTQIAPPPFGKEAMLSFCFFIEFFFINLLWSSFIVFLWSCISGKCLFLFFSFSTTWSLLLRICKYVLQSNVKLMVPWWKYTFQRVLVPSVGCLLLLLLFLVYYQRGLVEAHADDGLLEIFGLKPRVACIFCYVWTHLCQTHCSGAISNSKFLLFYAIV